MRAKASRFGISWSRSSYSVPLPSITIAVRPAKVACATGRASREAHASRGAVSQPADSSQKSARVTMAIVARSRFNSTNAAKKSANKVNRINLNGVTYHFRDNPHSRYRTGTGGIVGTWRERIVRSDGGPEYYRQHPMTNGTSGSVLRISSVAR